VQAGLPQVTKEQDVVTMFRETQKAGDQRILVMMVFVAVIFQPIVEEVLFRGYFYGVFKGWAGTAASAIFTATLFAAIHVNVAALGPLLVFALFLTLAYEWSGSLMVPIAMHMTFNGVQLAILTWAPNLIKQ
jgi:membrane protease YdiL (CAAX protease family)